MAGYEVEVGLGEFHGGWWNGTGWLDCGRACARCPHLKIEIWNTRIFGRDRNDCGFLVGLKSFRFLVLLKMEEG
jgi:hypothetical protein